MLSETGPRSYYVFKTLYIDEQVGVHEEHVTVQPDWLKGRVVYGTVYGDRHF